MDADAGTGTDAGVDATDSASAVDAEAGTGADVGAADAASDGSLSVDASGIDAGSLCTPFPDDAAPITSTDLDGSAPNPSTFTGGNIESGTYWLTSETTYGAGTTETVAQVSILDSTTQTDRSARLTNTLDAAATEYAGFGYATSGNQILLQALCNLTGLGTGYFTFSGTGPGATLTVMTSGVLDVYTKQ